MPMRQLLLAAALCFAALPGFAEESTKQQPENAVLKNLVLALQQVEVAAEIYAADMNAQIAVKNARIAEWEVYFKAYIGADK